MEGGDTTDVLAMPARAGTALSYRDGICTGCKVAIVTHSASI